MILQCLIVAHNALAGAHMTVHFALESITRDVPEHDKIIGPLPASLKDVLSPGPASTVGSLRKTCS